MFRQRNILRQSDLFSFNRDSDISGAARACRGPWGTRAMLAKIWSGLLVQTNGCDRPDWG
jgi:hypothetical protein